MISGCVTNSLEAAELDHLGVVLVALVEDLLCMRHYFPYTLA
jgi:hypothetical protein